MANVYIDNHYEAMKYLSPEGMAMERELKALADKYGYRALPKELSAKMREHYLEALSDFWKNEEYKNRKIVLTAHDGTILATGITERGVVCGDYGVFIEIPPDKICFENIEVQKGQEFRIDDPDYSSKVKYQWFTDKCGDGIKLYFQQKSVVYADYKPNMWYVSPYEVKPIVLGKLQSKELFRQTKGIICQQVNCRGAYGAGLSGIISDQYPEVLSAFRKNYAVNRGKQFGTYEIVKLNQENDFLAVANIYSQEDYGNPQRSGRIYTDWRTLAECIRDIANNYPELPIYLPHSAGKNGQPDNGIGCGYGGEKWEHLYEVFQNLRLPNLYTIDTYTGKTEKITLETSDKLWEQILFDDIQPSASPLRNREERD